MGSSPAQKAKEDIFLKNNLEYEQRLKAHLYQFDDDHKHNHLQSIDDSQQSERNESRANYRQTADAVNDNSKMAN